MGVHLDCPHCGAANLVSTCEDCGRRWVVGHGTAVELPICDLDRARAEAQLDAVRERQRQCASCHEGLLVDAYLSTLGTVELDIFRSRGAGAGLSYVINPDAHCAVKCVGGDEVHIEGDAEGLLQLARYLVTLAQPYATEQDFACLSAGVDLSEESSFVSIQRL
jgi:hypothetical protein